MYAIIFVCLPLARLVLASGSAEEEHVLAKVKLVATIMKDYNSTFDRMAESIVNTNYFKELDQENVQTLLDEFSSSITPEEAGDLNISITTHDLEILFNHGRPLEDAAEDEGRGGLRAFGNNLDGSVWPNKEMHYCFHKSINSRTRRLMQRAMAAISDRSCVKFREVSYSRWTPWRSCSEWDGVVIQSDAKGCWAHKGKKGWFGSSLNMGAGCGTMGIAQHEVLHGLGMAHEHNRPDRDNWVTINFKNIKDGKAHNFRKSSGAGTNQPYDLGSLMHYGAWDFSKNRQKTIDLKSAAKQTPYIRSGKRIGQRIGLSSSDWDQLQDAYTCAPAFRNQGRYCWSKCRKSGNCNFCGTKGACCRKGYGGVGCKGRAYTRFSHTCVGSSAPP